MLLTDKATANVCEYSSTKSKTARIV